MQRCRASDAAEAQAEAEDAEVEYTAEDRAMMDLSELLPNTVPTPTLEAQEVIEALYASVHPTAGMHYHAFFSSELGGIITDPALMFVHIDDHMLHRGHAVFDTCKLVEGHLYQLEDHLNRLLASAEKAGVPPPQSVDQMYRTILETAAASCIASGHVRYWLSAGRGGFGLSPAECEGPSFYCVVYTTPDPPADAHLNGWKVKTSLVPAKNPYFSTLKSTNYLVNTLCLMDAEADELDTGIFLDSDGNIAEGPNMNVAIITEDGTFVTPPFEAALPGITMQRLLDLLPENMGRDDLVEFTGVEQRHITLEEAKGAREVMMTSSSLPVMPVVEWDGVPINDGKAGGMTLALRRLLLLDAEPRGDSDQHVVVPYGHMTFMPQGEPLEDL